MQRCAFSQALCQNLVLRFYALFCFARRYLFEPAICIHAVHAFVVFGTNFAALTESPGALAAPPYSLSAVLIGVTFLSDGISGLIGSPIGGWVSDYAAAKHAKVPEARLMHNTLCTLLAMPAGLLLYGWVLQRGAHLALVILAQVGRFLFLYSCVPAVCVTLMHDAYIPCCHACILSRASFPCCLHAVLTSWGFMGCAPSAR
jgi:hypothetical protein